MTPPEFSASPADEELRAEVYRLLHVAVGVSPPARELEWVNGRVAVIQRAAEIALPAVSSPRWWTSPDRVRIASLLWLVAAWLVTDPDRTWRQRVRSMSWDLSEAFRDVVRGPSFRELQRRRYPDHPRLWTMDDPSDAVKQPVQGAAG